MVKDSGEASGPGVVRALNLPALIEVEEDERHRPVAVKTGGPASGGREGRRLTVASIEETWDICDEWWRGDGIARRYYRVITEDGAGATIFRDSAGGAWYRQRR